MSDKHLSTQFDAELSGISTRVLEMGGLLSHGAIVARELGIPAVVDVARATQLIRSGDRIEVDGTTGEVAVGGSGVSGEES